MPKGKLYINGDDAFEKYGLSISDQGLSALMAPAPVKSFVSNKNRAEHGTRVVANNMKFDERIVTIPFHIVAKDRDDFFDKYKKLIDVFVSGELEIWTQYQFDTIYRMYYQSCTQFGQYDQKLAKFSLRLLEPDPTNRSTENRKYKFFILDHDKLDEGQL